MHDPSTQTFIDAIYQDAYDTLSSTNPTLLAGLVTYINDGFSPHDARLHVVQETKNEHLANLSFDAGVWIEKAGIM